jgi:hypothetical protein
VAAIGLASEAARGAGIVEDPAAAERKFMIAKILPSDYHIANGMTIKE